MNRPGAGTARARRLMFPTATGAPGRRSARPSPGVRAADRRHGVLLGLSERVFWKAPGVHTGGRLRGRLHADADLQEVCSGKTGHTGRARGLAEPERVTSYEELLRDLFWEGHDRRGDAPGQRRRRAVPLGAVLDERGTARARPSVAGAVQERARRAGATGHDRACTQAPSADYQQCHAGPAATAASAARACRARSAPPPAP